MLLINGMDRIELGLLLERYGLEMLFVAPGEKIPGSYWGDSEAGLVGARLYVRPDTPLHSALHEGAHFACMTPERRTGLHTDAGGDTDEENAVCYLQVEWAATLRQVGRQRLLRDMDDWGYSFRLGSAEAWYREDALDAREWLIAQGILAGDGRLTYACR